MDIGKTVRVFTAEPAISPLPAERPEPAAPPGRVSAGTAGSGTVGSGTAEEDSGPPAVPTR